MKNNCYKWIIGILGFIVVLLISFLICIEKDIISFNFVDVISVSSTIISIVLSVIAIFYTFTTSKESSKINNTAQQTLNLVQSQLSEVKIMEEKNFEHLQEISKNMANNVKSAAQEMKAVVNESNDINDIRSSIDEKAEKITEYSNHILNSINRVN